MEPDLYFVELLSHPDFKTFFLDLLARNFTDEEKYARLVDYFRAINLNKHYWPSIGYQGQPGIESSAEMLGKEERSSILYQTSECIKRAVAQIARSQHLDGGWGMWVEQSDFWHTAHSILCLCAARNCPDLALEPDLDGLIQSGVMYLEQHPESWAVDTITPEGALSVYHLSLMVRCFYNGGRDLLRRDSAVRVYRGVERLHHAQNGDGGWDANLWGYATLTPTRQFSEVGATSAAMQALAEVGDERFLSAMNRASHWLAATQNTDGSWNNGSTRPDLGAFVITGDPRVNKTCDAVQGLLAIRSFELPINAYQAVISRAIHWLWRSEIPVLDKLNRMNGWGWGYQAADYENTCLLLETLLRMPDTPFPLLAANANWLVQSQRRQDDDPQDGKWILGHTARITSTLIAYHQAIKAGVQA